MSVVQRKIGGQTFAVYAEVAAELDSLAARLAEAERANAELNIEVSRLYACRNECDDVDRILRDGLRLDPERYRTEGGALNVPKILAAIKHPNDYPRLADSAPVLRNGDSLTFTSTNTKDGLTISDVKVARAESTADALPDLPPDTADIWCKHGVQTHVRRHCPLCHAEDEEHDRAMAAETAPAALNPSWEYGGSTLKLARCTCGEPDWYTMGSPCEVHGAASTVSEVKP